jgi:hypothetical protein
MPTFRNERSGEVVTTTLTREQLLARFAETTDDDNWLYFWIAKHVNRVTPAPITVSLCPQQAESTSAKDMIAFLGDSFMLALGMGLKRPMIRLHYKDRRYKVYLSARGTICFKVGAISPDTHDPVGDE